MKKLEPLVIEDPEVAIKLTEEQAAMYGITLEDKQQLKIDTRGPWQIQVSVKGLCVEQVWEEGKKSRLIIYGPRSMRNTVQKGYYIAGWVSVKGEQRPAFTTDQLFEIGGKLVDVGVLNVIKRSLCPGLS